jgi:hypothetical protein
MQVFEEALPGIPTVFGKLAWISSFRVAGSDKYRSPDLEEIVHPDIASSALRNLHNRLFASWLALRLREQSRDLTGHLETVPSKDGAKSPCSGSAGSGWGVLGDSRWLPSSPGTSEGRLRNPRC